MPAVIVGDLVQALLDAHAGVFAADTRVVDLLYSVIPRWRLTFPTNWLWTPRDMLDVWECFPTMPAIHALHLAGFVGGVCLHDHTQKQFLSCRCVRHVPG